MEEMPWTQAKGLPRKRAQSASHLPRTRPHILRSQVPGPCSEWTVGRSVPKMAPKAVEA